MMAQARAKNSNSFAIWISVIVVVILVAIGALVVWMNNAQSGPGTQPQSSAINTETGAIAVGTGSKTLDTYVDFMCPICGQFETQFGPTIDSMVADGSITLNIHPISILDRASQGTQYSTRSANAAYAVAVKHPDLALKYLQALFAQQPQENTSGLTNDQLVSIAEQVGATDVADDITKGTYNQYVGYITKKTPIQPGAAGPSTPTILIGGTLASNSQLFALSPEAFKATVLK
ncbi:thioredoxin domain-containing protein [uncultured Microbacterium sp.]|jgi:protein-disulfide isomerase|uniref:DsbA family protein n=1 Tax=uncultured Microbacterium sp. TaxID=191216 RepID=UPI0025E165E1|nr:thioredoxin domain-containing protein [uncultured Microbacterium sp.]